MGLRGIVVALSLGLAAASAAPAAVVFTASSGNRSAQATFEVTGSNLTLLLANTSLTDATVPTDVLIGVFFDSTTSLANLTRVSAVLGPGSTSIYTAAQPAGGVVGGEWGWRGNITNHNAPGHNGVSAAGLGLFGSGDRFAGANLSGKTSLQGLDWGITTAGDNPATGNGGLSGTPLVKDSVLFTWSNLPSGFQLTDLYNVVFQYGTSLTEPQIDGTPQINIVNIVPAPVSAGSGLLVMVGIAWWQRRRHR